VPQGILNTQYSWLQGRLACQIRAAVTCCVFRKTLLLSQLELDAFTAGGVQTLMAVDADRVRRAAHVRLAGSSGHSNLTLLHVFALQDQIQTQHMTQTQALNMTRNATSRHEPRTRDPTTEASFTFHHDTALPS
jgi:hypothetical protein